MTQKCRVVREKVNLPTGTAFTGREVYTETSIMDRTHLRFFTWHSFSELISQCGFAIEKKAFISRFSGPLLHIFFRLLAVQFIVKLKRR